MKHLRDETQSDSALLELSGESLTADNNASRGAPIKRRHGSIVFRNEFCVVNDFGEEY